MLIEDWMGTLLFLLGLILITLSFLSAIALVSLLSGAQMVGFAVFGFVLCLTGFAMARAVMGDVMGRFRR